MKNRGIKNELKEFWMISKSLDKKVVVIFISVAILQTISWYLTSRRFFRANLFDSLQFEPVVYLYEFIFWYSGDFITYFIIPVLIIKFLFKEPLTDYGLKSGDHRAGLKYSMIFLAVMLPLVWFVSSTPPFAAQYPEYAEVKRSWNLFFIYEACLLFYMAAWEFVWRGYMLFGLKHKFGYYAVLLQMLPFVILHNGKPMLETFGSIAAGIALGVLALRTGSVLYGIFIHFSVIFSIDLISVLRYRTEDNGIGVHSVINIFKGLF